MVAECVVVALLEAGGQAAVASVVVVQVAVASVVVVWVAVTSVVVVQVAVRKDKARAEAREGVVRGVGTVVVMVVCTDCTVLSKANLHSNRNFHLHK